MKTLARWLGLCLFFLLMLVVFAPKIAMYYALEKELQKENIVISQEHINDRWLDLDVRNGTLFYEEIEAGMIERIHVLPLLFYNRISISNARFSSEMNNFFPQKIERIDTTYSVINPLAVQIRGEGDFGTIEGEVDLMESKLVLTLTPSGSASKQYATLMRKFKKEGDVYIHESSL